MDPSSIGKAGNKVDEASGNRRAGSESGVADKGAQGTASTSDTVELTSSAKLLERLEKNLAAAPAIDSARIETIKQAIANGQYEINSEAIADAMIRFERSMGD